MASTSDAINSSDGVPSLCRPFDVRFGEHPALARDLVKLDPVMPLLTEFVDRYPQLALIFSITAPVLPAHVSSIDEICFFRPILYEL